MRYYAKANKAKLDKRVKLLNEASKILKQVSNWRIQLYDGDIKTGNLVYDSGVCAREALFAGKPFIDLKPVHGVFAVN